MVKQQDMATPASQGFTSYGVGPSAEAQRQANRALVTQAHEALFTRHDVSVLDASFAPGFIEHSPLVKDGLSGLRQLVAECPDMRHEAVRVLADGDLVAIHGRFIGLAETPLVGFDIYRVAQGHIVEHWGGLVPETPPNASSTAPSARGRAMPKPTGPSSPGSSPRPSSAATIPVSGASPTARISSSTVPTSAMASMP